MKKIAIILVSFLIIVIVGAGIAIKLFVTKDFIAQTIEDNINGRVEIGEIKVPLWAALSGVSVVDFKIGKKDAQMKKPMEEREAMTKAALSFQEFRFRVAAAKLITSMGKDFEIKSLLLIEPKADITLYEDGGDSLSALLIKPSSVESSSEEEAAPQEATEAGSEEFSIKSVPTVIKMGKIGIEKGQFTVNMEEYQNTIAISNFDLLLTDIHIDPANLADRAKNQVKLHAAFTAAMDENKKEGAVQSFNLILSLDSNIKPFHEKTGHLTEYLELEMRAHQGTSLTGLAAFEKLKDQTESLKKIGVSLDFLKDNLELTEDTLFSLTYDSGKITFNTPLTIQTEELAIALEKDSWMHIGTMAHLFTGSMILDKKYTPQVEAQVDQALGPVTDVLLKNLPSAVRSQAAGSLSVESMRSQVLKPALSDDGEIDLGFRSKGNLVSPSVAVVRPQFPTLKQVAQQGVDQAKSGISGAVSQEIDKAKAEAEAKARAEADKAKAEAEARAKAEADKAKAEAEAKAKAEAEAKAKQAAESAVKNLKF